VIFQCCDQCVYCECFVFFPQNGFEPGARFDGIAQPVLPAAPPGVPANAAQLAAMAGHNVALSQKKGSFLTGGTDGGYTFW